MAKKSYKDAMDAMKTLKSKIKKPKGIKEKLWQVLKKSNLVQHFQLLDLD